MFVFVIIAFLRKCNVTAVVNCCCAVLLIIVFIIVLRQVLKTCLGHVA